MLDSKRKIRTLPVIQDIQHEVTQRKSQDVGVQAIQQAAVSAEYIPRILDARGTLNELN